MELNGEKCIKVLYAIFWISGTGLFVTVVAYFLR